MKRWGFLFFPAVSLGVGTLAGFLTRNSLNTVYPMLEKSPLTPPGWVFPLVWTVLYLLMGLWGVQLGLNFCWSLLFFNGGLYFSALLCLVVLWVMILAMAGAFGAISRTAGLLQIPYLLWVAFAGYLNAAVWVLNL